MGKKALLAFLPFLSGCVIFSSPFGDLQTELDKHRALWDLAAITDYSMRFQRLCLFCGNVDLLIPVRVTVRADTIDSVTDLDTGDPVAGAEGTFLTIDEMFDTIQQAIDQNASEIDVRYDELLGYPTDVNIDLSRSFINDEAQFEIREFQDLT